jgi:hypothetical protein
MKKSKRAAKKVRRTIPDGRLRVGLWIQTPRGNTAHILGDPKMSSETMDALAEMVDAAAKAYAKGELRPPNDDKLSDECPS